MKREFVAGALLLLLMALSFFNVHYLERKTEALSALILEAEALYEEGDRQEAANLVQQSLDNWLDWKFYSHIMMRHSEIDFISDAYYELLESLEGDEAVTQASFHSVIEKLADIVVKERIDPGAIL